jgi:hypothetical protein
MKLAVGGCAFEGQRGGLDEVNLCSFLGLILFRRRSSLPTS